MSNARRRLRAVAALGAAHLYRPVRRDIIDMAMMRDIHIVLSLLVVIDGIDYFASGIRVIGPAALLQLLRLNVKIRVLYSSNSCFSTFCTTRARAPPL